MEIQVGRHIEQYVIQQVAGESRKLLDMLSHVSVLVKIENNLDYTINLI